MQYRRISADCHLDLPWLPRQLFVDNAAREFKDRMPFVDETAEGPRWKTKSGIDMGGWGGVGSVGGPFVPGQNYRVDKMAETGLYDAGKRGEARPGDPHLRIKEMEKDGVDAEIIFGILGVASRVRDHEAAWLQPPCHSTRSRIDDTTAAASPALKIATSTNSAQTDDICLPPVREGQYITTASK